MKTKIAKRRAAAKRPALGLSGSGTRERFAVPSASEIPPSLTASATSESEPAEISAKSSAARRPAAPLWQLRLYVMDQTPKSVTAFANLRQLCETHLKGRYRITVIDLLKQPQLAKGDQILAIPTVVRRLPQPVRTLIGNLSDTERVLVGLDLRAAA